MKIKLLRDARIRHRAGEIVEVSPAEAGFLISTASAVEVPEIPAMRETPEKTGEKSQKETRKK